MRAHRCRARRGFRMVIGVGSVAMATALAATSASATVQRSGSARPFVIPGADVRQHPFAPGRQAGVRLATSGAAVTNMAAGRMSDGFISQEALQRPAS